MNYVYLESKHNEFFVDEDTFEQIAALVRAGKRCTYEYRERHAYSLDNPCVGKGMCLEHTLKKHSYLTLLDCVGQNTDGQYIYRFLDRQGIVYSSIEDSTEQPTKDLSETMNYHGFMPPIKVEGRGGKSIDFHTYYATLYGDLTTASVIVLAYNHTSEKVKSLFLLYKKGLTKELSKKSDLYRRADELIEATKNERGEYIVKGYTHYTKLESHTLDVVSQLESAVYDATLKFQNDNHKEEETE
jgi:hypothetical protein